MAHIIVMIIITGFKVQEASSLPSMWAKEREKINKGGKGHWWDHGLMGPVKKKLKKAFHPIYNYFTENEMGRWEMGRKKYYQNNKVCCLYFGAFLPVCIDGWSLQRWWSEDVWFSLCFLICSWWWSWWEYKEVLSLVMN